MRMTFDAQLKTCVKIRNLIWGEHTRESCQHGTDIAPRHFRSREQRIIAVLDVKHRLVPNHAIA
jgi:hypothetical protein